MPKFYFDVYDGVNVLADAYGDDFETDDEAAKQAISLLPDMARDRLSKNDNINVAVSLRDEAGDVIYRSISTTRSQWRDRDKDYFLFRIDKTDFTISHSQRLRAEAQSLSTRMHVGVVEIISLIESAAAHMEVSHRLLRDDET